MATYDQYSQEDFFTDAEEAAPKKRRLRLPRRSK
jgi:hypothetical protein